MNTEPLPPGEAEQLGGVKRRVWRNRMAKATIAAAVIAAWVAILVVTLQPPNRARGIPNSDAAISDRALEKSEYFPAQYKNHATEIPDHVQGF